MNEELKPIRWVGSSYRDLMALPKAVRRTIGFALDQAQRGGKHPDAKPLKGFGGAGILEVVEDYVGDILRGIYTVRFTGIVYVLHAFQKKSKYGIALPKAEFELIKRRLRAAEFDYADSESNRVKVKK